MVDKWVAKAMTLTIADGRVQFDSKSPAESRQRSKMAAFVRPRLQPT